MTRVNIPLSLFAVLLVVAGCGSPSSETADKAEAKRGGEATETVGTLTGPGGSVSLGDTAQDFTTAFPQPKEATDPQDPSVPELTFVGWQTKDEIVSAAIRADKIVAMYHGKAAEDARWMDEARAKYGKPEHDVANDLGAFASWRQGANEHIVMVIKGSAPMTMQATGDSATLKLLQLDSAEIAGQLSAQGGAASGGHSPDDGHGH